MDESMKLEKVIDKEFENSERERSFKMEKNTPDMSLINVFLYREVDRLESEFDESYHEMQEELSKDKISAVVIRTNLSKMEKVLKNWKGQQNIVKFYDADAVSVHLPDFRSLMNEQETKYRNIEQKYQDIKSQAQATDDEYHTKEERILRAFGNFSRHSDAEYEKYKNFMDSFKKLSMRKKKALRNELEALTADISLLEKENREFVREFEEFSNHYVVTDRCKKAEEACRDLCPKTYNWKEDCMEQQQAFVEAKKKRKDKILSILLLLYFILLIYNHLK